MADGRTSETSKAMTSGYEQGFERLLLGENSLQGMARIVGFLLVYVVVFGTVFHFAASSL